MKSNFYVRRKKTAAGMGDQRNQMIKGSPSQYVKLNIGGKIRRHPQKIFSGGKFIFPIFPGFLYYTTIRTLTKVDCMLRAMFSGKLEVLTDAEGWILVDR